jgi:hypothetical protein
VIFKVIALLSLTCFIFAVVPTHWKHIRDYTLASGLISVTYVVNRTPSLETWHITRALMMGSSPMCVIYVARHSSQLESFQIMSADILDSNHTYVTSVAVPLLTTTLSHTTRYAIWWQINFKSFFFLLFMGVSQSVCCSIVFSVVQHFQFRNISIFNSS